MMTTASPIVALPMNCSPHRSRKICAERLMDWPTPTGSYSSTGTTKYVSTLHAIPTSPITIRPTMPAFSWIWRRIIPTVAVISAHTKIFPMCCRASASPSAIFASSPRSRFMAVPMTAALK